MILIDIPLFDLSDRRNTSQQDQDDVGGMAWEHDGGNVSVSRLDLTGGFAMSPNGRSLRVQRGGRSASPLKGKREFMIVGFETSPPGFVRLRCPR